MCGKKKKRMEKKMNKCCAICNKSMECSDYKIKPIVDKKRYYICSEECHKKWIENWKNNCQRESNKAQMDFSSPKKKESPSDTYYKEREYSPEEIEEFPDY